MRVLKKLLEAIDVVKTPDDQSAVGKPPGGANRLMRPFQINVGTSVRQNHAAKLTRVTIHDLLQIRPGFRGSARRDGPPGRNRACFRKRRVRTRNGRILRTRWLKLPLGSFLGLR